MESHLRKSFRRLLDGTHYGPPWGALLGASLEESGCGGDSWGLFLGLIEAVSSGAVSSMPPPCQRLWGGTRGADDKASARTTHVAVTRDRWERSVSFVHSDDPTVAMGVHDCGAARGGTGKNNFPSSS